MYEVSWVRVKFLIKYFTLSSKWDIPPLSMPHPWSDTIRTKSYTSSHAHPWLRKEKNGLFSYSYKWQEAVIPSPPERISFLFQPIRMYIRLLKRQKLSPNFWVSFF
jgi:hypothetical protein